MEPQELYPCKCGSYDVDVEWEDMDFSDTQIDEFYVECKTCGKSGKSALSYDLAIQNWNKCLI